MTAELAFFIFFAIGAIGGCLGVILCRNPINSAISLVAAFFFLAGHYVLLQAHFLAILQIMVYAGAIVVLFLFVLMLLNMRDEDLGPSRVNLTKLLATTAAAGIGTVLMVAVMGSRDGQLRLWVETFPESFGKVAPIGREMMTTYVLAFELVAILLLVGIVSAVVVAKRRL